MNLALFMLTFMLSGLYATESYSQTVRISLNTVEEAKVGLYTDWIKDRLVFDNDCLADILISMEGRYNMDIECPKQLPLPLVFLSQSAGEHRRGDGSDESDCSD